MKTQCTHIFVFGSPSSCLRSTCFVLQVDGLKMESWGLCIDAMKKESSVTILLTRYNSSGFNAKCFGVTGFIPYSLMDPTKLPAKGAADAVSKMREMLGLNLTAKIVEARWFPPPFMGERALRPHSLKCAYLPIPLVLDCCPSKEGPGLSHAVFVASNVLFFPFHPASPPSPSVSSCFELLSGQPQLSSPCRQIWRVGG